MVKKNNCPWNEWKFRKYEMVKKNNCFWYNDTFSSASLNGNLENMKQLKENNCPWDKITFEYASLSGNLGNMIWLKKMFVVRINVLLILQQKM